MKLRNVVDWVRPSFEGKDGKLSYRRVTAFVYIVVDLWMITHDKIHDITTLHVHYSMLAFILLMTGMITTQNVLTFFNKGSDAKE